MRNRTAFVSALSLLALIAIATLPARAAESSETVAEVTQLLTWFLAPENNPRAATHQRFWAEDVVYTSSSGVVRRKAEILASFDGSERPVDEMRWSAEDVLVRPYDDAAALTFRLVGRTADGSAMLYRNSALFLKRDGEWRAVTWQATRIQETPSP
jgi:hypothetical protein